MATHPTLFSLWFEGRMRVQGIDQQRGAADRVHTLLPGENLQTLREKLNKLVNATDGGAQHFLGGTAEARTRAAALAKVLGTTEEDLRAAYQRSRSRPTLILDPRLPPAFRSELLSRHTELVERLAVVEVPATADMKVALRDAARAEPNPIVVLADDGPAAQEERVFLEGADLRCATTWFDRRGWILSKPFEDLIPLPPPAQPSLFDTSGAPLRPVGPGDHLSAPLRSEDWFADRALSELAKTHVWPATRRGETYSLTLPQVLQWFACDHGRRDHEHPSRGEAPAAPLKGAKFALRSRPTAAELAGIDPSPHELRQTIAWTEGGKVFAFGPELERLRSVYAPWHEVHSPSWANCWETLTAPGVNPWWLEEQLALGHAEVFAPCRAILEDASDAPHRTRHREDAGPDFATVVRQFCGLKRKRLVEFARRAAPETLVCWANQDVTGAREALHALARRDARAAPECLRLSLVLRHAAESTLIVIPPEPPERWRVLIDPGGGSLLELRLLGLDAPPRPLVKVCGFRADVTGSDTRATYGGNLDANGPVLGEIFEGGDVLLSCVAFPSHLPGARWRARGA